MKVFAIPDVHGSKCWEKVIKVALKNNDVVIFLGDYFDCWKNKWPEQLQNFLNICTLKRKHPDKVKVLLGNHDRSYITWVKGGNCVSGHQNGHAGEIRSALMSNLDIIDLAFEADGCVYSHAGFSDTWVHSVKSVMHQMYDVWPDVPDHFDSEEEFLKSQKECEENGKPWDESTLSVELLNKAWHETSRILSDDNSYYEFEELLDWYGYYNGSGDEITQGPLWIRPTALLKDTYSKWPNQIVGHSEYGMSQPVLIRGKVKDCSSGEEIKTSVTVVDSPFHETFLIVEDGVPQVLPDYCFDSITDFHRWEKRIDKMALDVHSMKLESEYDKIEKCTKKDLVYAKDILIYERFINDVKNNS